MIFNSAAFLLMFLPLAAALFFAPGLERWRLPVAVVLSFAFYETSAGVRQVCLLALCIGWVHALSSGMTAPGSRMRLSLSIFLPTAVLIYYKYTDFLLSWLPGDDFGQISAKGVLPAGLSFYVFHLISYAIDRYRGGCEPPPRALQFACYVAFFPQLVAGPITRFSQVGEAIGALVRFRLDSDHLSRGVGAMVVGLACKVMLADPLSRALAPLWAISDRLSPTQAIFLVMGYSFQIYLDFYGYSLMAIGLGELFGVRLPPNFLRPYLSCDPREFWRRWHMSLSSWIRDYLYLPLGGNTRHARNILIVFAACGLWHGAGWNFVAWGLYHGLLVITYSAMRRQWDALPRPLATAITFGLVSAGWPLFVLDLPSFWQAVVNLVLNSSSANSVGGPTPGQWALLIGAGIIALAIDTDRLAQGDGLEGRWSVLRQVGLAGTALACLAFLRGSEPFLYFRF